jgi:hypothetical protein
MSALDVVVGTTGIAAVLAVIGMSTGSSALIVVCCVVAAIGFFGVIWAWLASHKIFIFPPLIRTKVIPRPPKK